MNRQFNHQFHHRLVIDVNRKLIAYCARFISVCREIPGCSDFKVTSVYLKKNILESVRQLFGVKGANSRIDILKFSPAEHRFVLRCSSDGYVRLRVALTLASTYEGRTCVYTVHRASPNLLSLTADSRTYVHGANS